MNPLGTCNLSIAFDKKQKYKLEIIGRRYRRSITNFVKECLHEKLNNSFWDIQNEITEDNFIEKNLWDVDDSARIVKLAIHAPELLEYEEQKIWKIITELPELWKGDVDKFGLPAKPYLEENFDFVKLQENWGSIIRVSCGSLNKKDLDIK